MELSLVKEWDNRFTLAYDSDYEKAQRIKIGEIYKCQITKPRLGDHHRKYFALLRLIFDNQNQYRHLDDLREDLIIEAGFFYTQVDLQGIDRKKAKSIAFDKMDQWEFQELYDRTKDVVCLYLRITNEMIEEEIHRYY